MRIEYEDGFEEYCYDKRVMNNFFGFREVIQLTPAWLCPILCLTLLKIELYGWRLHFSILNHWHGFRPTDV